MRRRHHAHVDAARPALAHSPDLAFLEHAQQRSLRSAGQIADLVEEDDATVRGLEHAGVVAVGPGERAASVTEQLGEEQALRQRRAVDGDEGAFAPRRLGVQPLRRQLLAGPGLAVQQYR